MTSEYTPNYNPIVFCNALSMLNKPDPVTWTAKQFARGKRLVWKFHDPDVDRDISAIRHGIPDDVREILEFEGQKHLCTLGNRCEIFTVSHHGSPFIAGDEQWPVDPENPESLLSFRQSALSWVFDSGFTPRIWIGNGSSRKRLRPLLAVNKAATKRLAQSFRVAGITICSEAYGEDHDGIWDLDLIRACPLLATLRYMQIRDPDNKFVVPDGAEMHVIFKNAMEGTDLDKMAASLRERGFIIGSGGKIYDKYVEGLGEGELWLQ